MKTICLGALSVLFTFLLALGLAWRQLPSGEPDALVSPCLSESPLPAGERDAPSPSGQPEITGRPAALKPVPLDTVAHGHGQTGVPASSWTADHDSAAATMDKPDEAMAFFVEQRLAPGRTQMPMAHLARQLALVKAREASLAVESGAAGGSAAGAGATAGKASRLTGDIQSWQALGPGNIGGRTRAIAIDPDNPVVMYSAGVSGGIWKSTDAGMSWVPLDDMMLNLAVCTIVIDPVDTDVIYAGTGEGYVNDIFVRGLGIFKSTDAGATWIQLPGTVSGVPEGAFYYVNKLAISPNDHERLYAATRSGVWRSLDAGQTWSVVLSNPWESSTPPFTNGCTVGCTDIAVRPDSDPDLLLAAFGSYQRDGLFRSEDGGDSWLMYTTPDNQGRMTIAFAPSDNDVVYLLMADNGTVGARGQLVQLFRSDDGLNFTAQVDMGTLTGPWLLSNLALATGCFPGWVYSQGWYDNIVAVDPLDPYLVWVGGVDIFRSSDGGVNFEIAGYWFFYMSDPIPPDYVHPDHHTIVFHPDYDGFANQTMYVGNDGGIFRTQNARAAASMEDCPLPADEPRPEIVWESLNNGYAVTQFYHGDSAIGDDVFVGGAQDNGTSRVQAAGTPDNWRMISGGDGGYVAIDPTNSQVMYVEINGFPTMRKSTDGGETFADATSGITDTDGIFITPFAMDQANPDILWTGGSRPWRTMNGAAGWSPAGPDLSGPAQISAIAIAPSDSNVVYLGFTNGYVARTTNGLSPSPKWDIFVNGLYGGWVSSVAVDPADPDIAYCTYSTYNIPHVLQTVNGGLDWTSIDGIATTGVPDIPVHWIAIRPGHSNQLYAGTELGVFASDDTGGTWAPANAGLAHTVVETLDFRDENRLVAFSFGRGAFQTFLGGQETVAAQLNCLPASGTVPFTASFSVTLENNEPLRPATAVAARIDVTLAGGISYSGWKTGSLNIARGASFSTGWSQGIPALGSVIGDNVFKVVAEDVTPSPYNQPPYAPSGGVDSDSCTVTGVAP